MGIWASSLDGIWDSRDLKKRWWKAVALSGKADLGSGKRVALTLVVPVFAVGVGIRFRDDP